MFAIPESSYREFLRRDKDRIAQLAWETGGHYAYIEPRRFGQRFYDHFKLHKLTRTEDCIHADRIYNEPDFDTARELIRELLDKGQ